MNYRCRIEIDVEAIDPVAAANKAYELLLVADAMKPVVDVRKRFMNEEGSIVTAQFKGSLVDLSEVPSLQTKTPAPPDEKVEALKQFIKAYYNPGGSMDWSLMDEVFQHALSITGITEEQLNAEIEALNK